MFQRGDIVSVNFPFTDLASEKQRPALIISNDLVNSTGDVIIVMITSKHKDDIMNIPITANEVSVPLPKDSFVRCHRLATIDKTIIQKKISEAKPPFIDKVVDHILFLIKEKGEGVVWGE